MRPDREPVNGQGNLRGTGGTNVFTKIMTPVDLAHADRLGKALKCSADLAKLYQIPVVYVGVTSEIPGSVAHTPAEYAGKLSDFARAQAEAEGIQSSAHSVVCHDPTIELDEALLRAVTETEADLVVMASHVPGLTDYIWPSNGGKVAAHAKATVMVVR